MKEQVDRIQFHLISGRAEPTVATATPTCPVRRSDGGETLSSESLHASFSGGVAHAGFGVECRARRRAFARRDA